MKNKINVDVFVPSLNETYNLFIPVNKTVGEVVQLVCKAVNELTDGEYPISNNLSLIDLDSGVSYNFEFSIKDNKVKNGSRLVLL